jgi:predicted DNA-binding transcriptional regulator AlpA
MIERLITEKEASSLTSLSVAWFQRKRWEGGGPPFIKFEHAVRYRESELAAWIDEHGGRKSTTRGTPMRSGRAQSP